MLNLYDRLTELESVMRTLTNDLKFFRGRCDYSQPQEIDSNSSVLHRAYVRVVFALIESLLEQQNSLLLDLHECGIISIDNDVVEKLREQQRFLRLPDKIKIVHKTAAIVFGQKDTVDCSGGWEALLCGVRIRNRITHPKSYQDCVIDVQDLRTIDEGEACFRKIHNQYVSAATAHRMSNGWKRA